MYSIEAPEVEAPVGGLLSVVEPESGVHQFAFYNGAAYVSSLMSGAPQPVPTDGSEKQFEKLVQGSAEPVTVYKGVDASILDDEDEALSRLRDAFQRGLSNALESHIQSSVLNGGAVINDGTPVSDMRLALGMLQQWASQNILGRPLIHANRLATSLIPDVEQDGMDLFTPQFTQIANGGGYGQVGPDGAEAPMNEAWLYVSAMPTIYAGELAEVPGIDLADNRNYTLLEQMFLTVVQGPVGAVKVQFAQGLVPPPEVVTAEAPTRSGNTVTAATTEGVTYDPAGETAIPTDGSLTVDATADAGYVLADGSQRSWSFSWQDEPVTPAEPTRSANTVTVPSTQNVTYDPASGDHTIPTDGSLTVTATADAGYVIADGAADTWTFDWQAQ